MEWKYSDRVERTDIDYPRQVWETEINSLGPSCNRKMHTKMAHWSTWRMLHEGRTNCSQRTRKNRGIFMVLERSHKSRSTTILLDRVLKETQIMWMLQCLIWVNQTYTWRDQIWAPISVLVFVMPFRDLIFPITIFVISAFSIRARFWTPFWTLPGSLGGAFWPSRWLKPVLKFVLDRPRAVQDYFFFGSKRQKRGFQKRG